MKLELYYYEQCPFCYRVLEVIKELGLGNSVELKNTLTDQKNRDFHMTKTGRTTVPCLYIDDTPLFESMDIINWLNTNQNKIKG